MVEGLSSELLGEEAGHAGLDRSNTMLAAVMNLVKRLSNDPLREP
jgi:hypothetical protein